MFRLMPCLWTSHGNMAAYVSTNKTELRGYSEIEEGLYFEKNTSTWMKISVLRRLFKLYNVDPMDLVFYLRDENESADDTEINEKQLIRKNIGHLLCNRSTLLMAIMGPSVM